MNYGHLAAAIIVWLIAVALSWLSIDDAGPATPVTRTAGRLLCVNLLIIIGFYVLFGHMALSTPIGFAALAGVVLLIW